MIEMDQYPIIWEQWPPSVPRPTAEEHDAAVLRFREENDRFREQARVEGRRAYGGDTGISLSFDMATCNIGTWWHYFFPNDADRKRYENLWL